ncbi:MAG: NAD(P)H-hydrate dehydratase [Bacteroidaceae bacterium]|nr:NAD(P)H-hydrate dehydratase [Bacteroidaceae bacterium]
MKILTAGQFRELDLYTMEHEPIASIDLMERAAHAVAEALKRRFVSPRHLVVFAGPGGNGGDGLATARLLAAEGWTADVYLFNVGTGLSEDCATNRDRLSPVEGVNLVEITAGFTFPELRPSDIVVDALFGTGLNKPLSGGFAQLAKRLNRINANVVAIDMPSGLMCEDNSYNTSATIIRAKLTVSIQTPKLAFLFAENYRYCGEVEYVNIGLSQEGIDSMKSAFWLTEPQEACQLLRHRSPFAHKGTAGHALLVAGKRGMAGAAILASRAALRAGLGKLTLHTPFSNLDIIQTSVPEAIVSMDIDSNVVTEAQDATSFQAVGIGPGLGTDRCTAVALHGYLKQQLGPMVLDADALNLLADNREWLADLPHDTILTPHPREFDRLTSSFSDDSYERLNRARSFAINYHCFLVLKGHYTQLCTPTGTVIFNTTGNAGMATAGSGDVLTGIILGLLAQGYLPAEAAQLGVYLHGLAGDLAAKALGEASLIASDIIAYLPAAFKELSTLSTDNGNELH